MGGLPWLNRFKSGNTRQYPLICGELIGKPHLQHSADRRAPKNLQRGDAEVLTDPKSALIPSLLAASLWARIIFRPAEPAVPTSTMNPGIV
jgi:hypothetical protein